MKTKGWMNESPKESTIRISKKRNDKKRRNESGVCYLHLLVIQCESE